MGLLSSLLLSCRKASLLLEKQRERKLSLLERIQLRWHLGICDCCTTYAEHSAMIDRWMEQHRDKCATLDCTEFQERILQRIEAKE